MTVRFAPLLAAVAATLAAVAFAAPATASADSAVSPSAVSPSAPARAYAPLNRPGPKLTVRPAKLRRSLVCSGTLAHSAKEPVLLNPATGVTARLNYAWNYEKAFTAEHRPWCAVTMLYHTLGDIQTAGEYLVHAIRVMHRRAGERIAVMGHSQGGMSMRWALRFWPDTRSMVDDVIGMAGSNHGTTAQTACFAGTTKCPPATWQQAADAHFIEALNSRTETFAGISYTEIFTHTDEVVQPNYSDAVSSSALHTGKGAITNVSTQDICPLDGYEHLGVGTVDPVTYALAEDALNHAGPAKPGRIDRSVCLTAYQPRVDPTSADTYLDALAAAPGLLAVATPDVNTVGAPEVSREPKLRCYVFARGC